MVTLIVFVVFDIWLYDLNYNTRRTVQWSEQAHRTFDEFVRTQIERRNEQWIRNASTVSRALVSRGTNRATNTTSVFPEAESAIKIARISVSFIGAIRSIDWNARVRKIWPRSTLTNVSTGRRRANEKKKKKKRNVTLRKEKKKIKSHGVSTKAWNAPVGHTPVQRRNERNRLAAIKGGFRAWNERPFVFGLA